jgi:signal transduction histidine kinase
MRSRWLARLDTRIALTLAGCTTLVCWALCVAALVALWCVVDRSDVPPEELSRLVEERAAEGSAFVGHVDPEGRQRWLGTLEGRSRFRVFTGVRLDVYAERARIVSPAEGDLLCAWGRRSCRTEDGLWHVMAPIGSDGDRLAVSFRGDTVMRDLRPMLLASALFALLPAGAIAGMVALVVAAFVTRGLRVRTRRIREVVDAWSSERFDARILDGARDELGGVCAQLDAMAASLDRTRERDRAWAAEEERTRLLRLLHDDVKQDLFAAAIHLGLAGDGPPAKPASSKDHAPLAKATYAVERARRALDRLMADRPPSAQDGRSISAAVGLLVETWGREVLVEGDLSDDPSVPSVVVDFVRETVINAFRHAAATLVTVRSGQDASSLWVAVKDDGSGAGWFCLGTHQGGLARLRNQVERAGGLVVIDASARGSTVRAVLPRMGQ